MRNLLTLIFILIGISVFAQDADADHKNSENTYHLGISTQPSFLYNNALKIDVEIQQKQKISGFIVGLELYSGTPDLLYTEPGNVDSNFDDQIKGFGLNLAYKIKLKKNEILDNVYFSPGITLRKANLLLQGKDFYTYKEDGLEFYTYGDTHKKHKINSGLFYGVMGYQKVWKSFLSIDIYLGIGFKKSTKNEEVEKTREFETPFYGYNHNGLGPVTGFKIGYQIK